MDRRQLFALGGMGVLVAGGTGAKGAEIPLMGGGVIIQVRYYRRTWEVLVPELDGTENLPPIEGYMVATKWIPLSVFLSVMDGTA